MRRPVVRLASLATAVCLAALLGLAVLPISRDGLQRSIEPLGLWAAPAFIVVAAVLAMAFVPGPLLSAASGALFGTWLGFGCSVTSATLTAVLSVLVARHSGSAAVEELSGRRALALAGLARRHGLLVVVLQRLMPGVPDVPFSYLFGLARLRVWQAALGTVIGSAPRAFSYTALGDAAVTGNGRLAAVAAGVGIAVSVVGAVAGSVVLHRQRGSDREVMGDGQEAR